MDNKVVRHYGRRFKRSSGKNRHEDYSKMPSASILPPPTPPSGKSREFIDNSQPSCSFPHQRFKPLPSIGSRDYMIETDSAVDLRSPEPDHPPWSHMTTDQSEKSIYDHCTDVSRDGVHHTTEHNLTTLVLPNEPPPHSPYSVTIGVRLPNGNRTQRRFTYTTHTVHTLVLFAVHSLPPELLHGVTSLGNVELSSCSVPRIVYSDLSATLEQAGLTHNTLLCLSVL